MHNKQVTITITLQQLNKNSENSNMSIFNLTEAKAWSNMVKEQNINVSQLPAGLYMLKISKNKETQTIRFVKQ